MFYGIMKGDEVLVTDEQDGKPIIEAKKPDAPSGYHADQSFVDTGAEIHQTWSLVPDEGTASEAAVALAKMQAESLDDSQALKVPALYDEWSGDGIEYKKGDRRRYQGTLVKCLQDHTSQPDWAPNAAPSLWAVILPGQDGSGVEVGIWTQPGPENAYQKGDRVIHNGHLWESDFDGDNVWEPGQVGAHWVDLGEWDGGTSLPSQDGGE